MVDGVFTNIAFIGWNSPQATRRAESRHHGSSAQTPGRNSDKVVGVISVRDLLREAVEHHVKVISELERERMTMLTSTA
jgi:hypothetical protein